MITVVDGLEMFLTPKSKALRCNKCGHSEGGADWITKEESQRAWVESGDQARKLAAMHGWTYIGGDIDHCPKCSSYNCPHGQLARSCEICERDQLIAELEGRLDSGRRHLNNARINAEMIQAGEDTVTHSVLQRSDMMRLAKDIIAALDWADSAADKPEHAAWCALNIGNPEAGKECDCAVERQEIKS